MPEEINRVATDRVSDLLLAPSPDAVDNLRAEGYAEHQIELVGNVMIDTLLANVERARSRPVLDELGVEPASYGLLTLHRPANVDDPTVLLGLLERNQHNRRPASDRVSRPSPNAGPAPGRWTAPERQCRRASGLPGLHRSPGGARLVLTDSGGLQEETTASVCPA